MFGFLCLQKHSTLNIVIIMILCNCNLLKKSVNNSQWKLSLHSNGFQLAIRTIRKALFQIDREREAKLLSLHALRYNFVMVQNNRRIYDDCTLWQSTIAFFGLLSLLLLFVKCLMKLKNRERENSINIERGHKFRFVVIIKNYLWLQMQCAYKMTSRMSICILISK